jgi:hypothetical protein
VANQYVDTINAVRAAVTQPANYTGTWTPLPNVTWSDTVAASAQAWANNLATNQNCNLVHESQNTYGENLAMGTNLTPQQAVDIWAGEKSAYTWSPTYSMADFNAGSGHYNPARVAQVHPGRLRQRDLRENRGHQLPVLAARELHRTGRLLDAFIGAHEWSSDETPLRDWPGGRDADRPAVKRQHPRHLRSLRPH